MQYKEVTVIKSPVSERYFKPGCQGEYDASTRKIRIGGVWFDVDEDGKRWDIVANEGDEKKKKLLEEFSQYTTLEDPEFDELITAYNVDEETAMQWMVEAGNFERIDIDRMWFIKHLCALCDNVCHNYDAIFRPAKSGSLFYCSELCKMLDALDLHDEL